jgi:hypothetical protein
MPLIKFDDDKVAEGLYLLATHGQVGCYPDHVFAVSERLLKDLDEAFRRQGITYRMFTPQNLKSSKSVQGVGE